MFTAKLFGVTGRIAANRLPHLLIDSNAFTERSAAYYFLPRRRELLQVEIWLTAQFPDGSLQHNIEVFTDNPRALLRKVQRCFNARSIELIADSLANAPDILNRNKHQ